LHVKVECNCESFKYWGPARNSIINDYALSTEYRIDTPTRNIALKDRTPVTQVKLCKHLLALGKYITSLPIASVFDIEEPESYKKDDKNAPI
jgi:hypothetical protein